MTAKLSEIPRNEQSYVTIWIVPQPVISYHNMNTQSVCLSNVDEDTQEPWRSTNLGILDF